MTVKARAQEALAGLAEDVSLDELLFAIKARCELDQRIEIGELLSTRPAPPAPSSDLLGNLLGLMIPLLMIGGFLFGIPLGYKLIFGGKSDPIYSGRIEALEVAGLDASAVEGYLGLPAAVVSDYLVIEHDGRQVLIAEANLRRLVLGD